MMEHKDLLPLALLYAADGQQVNGRTRLQKLAFLTQERLEGVDGPFKFIPYDYGPFSKGLLDRLERLETRGHVEIDEELTYGGSKRYTYRLTDDGADQIERPSFDSIERRILEEARAVVAEFDDVMLFELLDHVYDRHPKYKERSVLY